ncbi:MAG: hypothetical protein AAF074_09840 [Pseudomonadota bacterium]
MRKRKRTNPARGLFWLGVAAALGAAVALAPHALANDVWLEAEAAAAKGDCAAAEPLYRAVLDTEPEAARQIAATQSLALCVALGETPWEARELMANLLPVVQAQSGPRSGALARHHGLWAEAEVRAGALNVAWRRSEAAVTALRAAGKLDPFDLASELYRLAAIQLARGEGDAFLAFLAAERQRLASAVWATDGDDALFDELMGTVPAPGDAAALLDWTRAGLQEFDPRPLYLALIGETPA